MKYKALRGPVDPDILFIFPPKEGRFLIKQFFQFSSIKMQIFHLFFQLPPPHISFWQLKLRNGKLFLRRPPSNQLSLSGLQVAVPCSGLGPPVRKGKTLAPLLLKAYECIYIFSCKNLGVLISWRSLKAYYYRLGRGTRKHFSPTLEESERKRRGKLMQTKHHTRTKSSNLEYYVYASTIFGLLSLFTDVR